MRKLGFGVLAALAFSLAIPLWAGESTAMRLPENLGMHLSIRSYPTLVESVSDATYAILRGTSKALPPGAIRGMAELIFPAPLDLWESGKPIHLLMDRDFSSRACVLLSVENFDDFIQRCRDEGWKVEEQEMEFPTAVFSVTVPQPGGEQKVDVVDAGNGFLAVAKHWTDVLHLLGDSATEDWLPVHPDDADIYVCLNALPVVEKISVDDLLQEFSRDRARGLENMRRAGLTAQVAEGILSIMDELIEPVLTETANLRNLIFKVRLDGSRVTLAISLQSADDNDTLHRFAAFWQDNAPPANELMLRVKPGVVSAGMSVPTDKFFPDDIVPFLSGMVAKTHPDHRERFEKLLADFLGNLRDGTVTVAYLNENASANVYLSKCADVDAAVELAGASFPELLNLMLSESVADPGDGVTLSVERFSDAAIPYTRIHPVFANPETAEKFYKTLNQGRVEMDAEKKDAAERLAIYITKLDDILVIMSGSGLDEALFLEIARGLADADSPLYETEPVQRALSELQRRQVSVGFIDIDRLAEALALQYGNLKLRIDGDGSWLDAMERGKGQFVKNGEFLGMTMGADAGLPCVEVKVSLKAINGMVKNGELFNTFLAADAKE